MGVRKGGGKRRPLPDKIRKAVLDRDSRRCKKCHERESLEIHHILAVQDGGTDELHNLDTLCARCHAEWTWSEPTAFGCETWLTLPPARRLREFFAILRNPDVRFCLLNGRSAADLLDMLDGMRVLP